MEPETVYNPTTVSASVQQNRRNYLDNISYASLNPKRCANVALVVVGVLSVMIGMALILYGSLFYVSIGDPPEVETTAERERREAEMSTYMILVYIGIPILLLGCVLWIYYLHRTGRCKYCPLCPGAMKRRRLRNNFQAQCLEAGNVSVGNISNNYSEHPTRTLPLDEQDRLMSHGLDDQTTGLADTDAMLFESGTKPVLRPMQTTI